MKKQKILKDVEKRIKRSNLIEAAARQMCFDSGIDPDRFVCKMMPEYMSYPIPTFYCPNPQHTMPAWWLFKSFIEHALEIVEK